MRRVVAASGVALALACGVDPSPGATTGDGGPGGASRDAYVDDTVAIDPGPHASFRVVVSTWSGLRPASGFAVRAEAADGTVVEATTSDAGLSPPELDGMAGPWDLTVARAGCTAVSILGIDGPLAGDVGVSCRDSEPIPPAHLLDVGVEGVTDYSNGWRFCPGAYLDTSGAHVVFHEGAPPLDLWVVQSEGNVHGSRPLSFARSGPIVLGDTTLAVTLRMPATPPAARHAVVRVQLPSAGLLTAERVASSEYYESAWRGGDDVELGGLGCAVGSALWTPPDASGEGAWTFDTLDVEGTQPTSASIPIGVNDPTAVVGGELTVHTVADGDRVVVAPVSEVPEVADGVDVPRLHATGADFDHVAFYGGPIGLEIHGAWLGYTFGAGPVDRPLPSLPSTVSLPQLVTTYPAASPVTSASFRFGTCGLRMHEGMPWQPGATRDLRLCGTSSAVLSR